jgi:hypothetical protein
VYKLTADTDIEIKNTLRHKPKVAVLKNAGIKAFIQIYFRVLVWIMVRTMLQI